MARGLVALASVVVVAVGASCVRDTDCGVCDPDHLILESISGIGYAAPKVHLLGPTCRGDRCPGTIEKGSYFVEEVVPCENDAETAAFIASLVDRGVVESDDDDAIAAYRAEFCRLSPLVVFYGIEFVFNNLLDPTSVELIRKRPDQPKLFEAYDWKTKILSIAGPVSRYNGDFAEGEGEAADVVTRLVSLACIDNLRDRGEDYGHEDRADPTTDPCNFVWDHDGDASTPATPMKMRIDTPDAEMGSYRGVTTTSGHSCDTPQDGADTCCTECDFLLGTAVAKYGVDAEGRAVEPGGGAIECDPVMGDPYVQCRDFRIAVDRSMSHERTYSYYWEAPPGEGGKPLEDQPIPQYDRLRETHFDERPAWIEQRTAKCSTDLDCKDVHGLGPLGAYACVGETATGEACMPERDAGCTAGVCRAQWFVGCQAVADTTGGTTGYCRDFRFDDAGAAGCMRAGDDFEGQCDAEGQDCTRFVDGQRLANCNGTVPPDTRYTAQECCQSSLGAEDLFPDEPGMQCDPYFQPELKALARHDRNDHLPDPTRECVCRPLADMSDEELEMCGELVLSVCHDDDGQLMPHRDGQFAMKFVERPGGVVYDPAIKGLEWKAGDIGSVPRARLETCAEGAGLIGERTRLDGWRTNDNEFIENYEDYDRAMCSGQEYTVRFALPGEGEHVVDKVGNTMLGHAEYTFTTTQFHVIPQSGQPSDNLRIGACDDFRLVFSNKYDMSPENQRKLEIWRVDAGDPDDPDDDTITTPNDDCGELVPAAGGPDCVENGDALADRCAAPCLTVNVSQQRTGEVAVRIDPVEFRNVLQVGERYRITAFALDEIEDMSDPELYQRAFWDACGMPLVKEAADPWQYDFTIDVPKCTEDVDLDEIAFSCDNADNYFNPDQSDLDFDGIGDVVDKCPTLKGETNSADSDKDGVGNECDACRQTTTQYNKHENEISVPDYMFVRNVPSQLDADEDGIGDVCDNCVVVANCQDYGPDNPYQVGDALAFDDASRCQRDDGGDLVGDLCTDLELEGAAGPVGIGDADDFDQDGVSNVRDGCPRQPLPERIDCTDASGCPDGRACDDGVCDHLDSDDDSVGDICDTCPFSPNPLQTMDGETQEEDQDGDFVGDVCETHSSCAARADARPFAFHGVSVDGLCCTVQLVQDGAGNLVNAITERQLLDPDGWPVRLDCVEAEDAEDRTCRRLPAAVENAPGVLVPPPGCEAALADAGITALENVPLTPDDVGSLDALWNRMCFLPQTDQDSDGLGDPCDLCPFAYDPDNWPFVDESGRAWPTDGKYCNGAYNPEKNCPYGEDDDTGTGSDSGGDSTDASGGATGDTGSTG